MGLLDGRVVLVSGGTQGVGAGVARAAAREGATVAVTGRRRELGEKLVAELGVPALFVPADVAERVNGLVNSAGLTRNAAHAHRFDRIRINGLDIGWTATEGEDATQRAFHDADDGWRERAAASLPMGKLGQVDEIAEMVVFLLSDRSGVVTGSVLDYPVTL